MNWLLLSFLGTAGAIVVALCVMVLFLRHRINRRHRVHPKVPTPAPITWLADPRAGARLHRRLAKVGRAAGSVAGDHRIPAKRRRKPVEQPQMVMLAEELRRQAINLDVQIARTTQLPAAARRQHLAHLESSVSQAEFACVRLVSVSAQVQTPAVLTHGVHTDATDITDVAGQVERLAEAHRILQQLDAEAGLTPAVAPMPPPRQVPSTF